MAEETYDWGEITGQAVRRLKARKIPPVPAPIVRQAQRSWDGVPDPENEGEKLHSLHFEFPSEKVAADFAKHMRNAGHHTTPKTTVSVVIDPENEGNKKLVGWKAGTRRGPGEAD